MRKISEFCQLFTNLLSRLNFMAPILGRITLAGGFIETGWGKIHNIPKVTEYFITLGIPSPEIQAHIVAYSEFFCGALILIGLFTRIASAQIFIMMTVAILTAKRPEIQSFTDIFGFIEFLYIVIAFWLIVEGPGKYSLDSLIKKKFQK